MDVQKMIRTGIIGQGQPRSLTLDFTKMGDGGIGLLGSTWVISSGKAINTPSLVTEILTDGGLENWLSATDLTSWSESKAGSSTVNREATEKYEGNYSARLDVDELNSNAGIGQIVSTIVDQWYTISAYTKSNINGKTIGFQFGSKLSPNYSLSTTFTQINYSVRADSATPALTVKRVTGSTSSSLYIDKCSLKQITHSSLIASRLFGLPTGTVKAGWNIVAGTPAGVVMNMDSIGNPQNMVTCLHNGTNLILSKRVNGTVTELINTAATYVAGALVEIRRAAGTNTYQAFYNGSQVGTDQTISDASIINNKYHGIMSTHSQNQCLNFSFVGA